MMNSPKFVAVAALLVLIAVSNADSMSSVSMQGMPDVHLGDDVEAVQKSLNTTMEPEEMESATPPNSFLPKKTQLRLKTRGVWVFFTKGKVTSIRLDVPFAGNIGGIKLGDSSSKIQRVLGAPIKQIAWANLTNYMYYLDDVTTVRFAVNRDDQLETIFLDK
jgi:hypothetical protein